MTFQIFQGKEKGSSLFRIDCQNQMVIYSDHNIHSTTSKYYFSENGEIIIQDEI